jgi:hypothetical protein
MTYVMPTDEAVTYIRTAPLSEARDDYTDRLNDAATVLSDPQSWLDLYHTTLEQPDATLATIMDDHRSMVEDARKVWVLAAAKAGVYRPHNN